MPEINFSALHEPFEHYDIEWRVQQAGKSGEKIWARVLAYIQARAIQNRLDTVAGPHRWQVKYRPMGNGIICEIGIMVQPGVWVWKEDGAEQTDIEAFKGGISSAMKRAAVLWGVGRYLYDLDAGFAQIVPRGTEGARFARDKNIGDFYWVPPKLPDWALPKKKERS